MEIKGNTFIVTGGASGLGEGTVRMLAGGGAKVIIADLRVEQGEALAAELGASVRFVRTDVIDETAAQAAVAAALSNYGGLAGLVSCAGIVHGEKVVGREGPHSLASFARTVSINLVGMFNMIRLAAEVMGKAEANAGGERGVIVNTASVAAFDGQIGQAAYAASKGGIVAMTLPLARDLARSGIRVMTIAPGIFRTPMMQDVPESVQEALGRMVPFPPRLGRPEEFASLVAEIIRNPMLNGEVIRLDGAIRMAPK